MFWDVFAYIQIKPKFGVAHYGLPEQDQGHISVALKLAFVLTKERVEIVPRRT